MPYMGHVAPYRVSGLVPYKWCVRHPLYGIVALYGTSSKKGTMLKNNGRVDVRYSKEFVKAIGKYAKKVNESKSEFIKKAIIARCKAIRTEELLAPTTPPPKLEKQETEREKMEREDLEDMYRRISASES